LQYADLKNSEAALSTPASGNHSKIEAQPVVDKAVKPENTTFENSN
jgi:hypothetical protein